MKFLYVSVFAASLVLVSAFGAASPSANGALNSAVLSPVPPYPPTGVIPASLEHQYIFRDFSTGNLILSYPAELIPPGSPMPGTVEAGRVKQIVVMHSNIDPLFDVSVARHEGNLQYSYTLHNGR